jgi:hypothetical protein
MKLSKTSKVIIGVTLAAVIGIGLYEFFKSRRKKMRDKTPIENSYLTKSLSSGILLTIPNSKWAKYDIIYLWGGINYATPSWMLSKVPKKLLLSNIFAVIPYNVTLDAARKIVEPYLAENGYAIADTSIMGFSAGALPVQENYSPDFKFVGLIDPSTRVSYSNKIYGSNTYMSYWLNNWAGVFSSFDYKAIYPKLEQSVKNSGGFAENIKLAHDKFPAYFMEKFFDEINKPKS